MNIKHIGTYIVCACACLLTQGMVYANPGDSLAQRTAKDFTAVAKEAIPAVVSIKVKTTTKSSLMDQNDENDPFGDDFFRFFFGQKPNQKSQPTLGQASGFIVSPDGLVITNSHVVRDASEILVTLNDEREFTGKVLGQDPNTDIAVVKIDVSEQLPYLQLGNSDNLEIGEWVIAIGNPFGLQATLTVGVVSAKGRNNLDIANVEDFIQTDAAINRGNSGGPLLNLDGKVMGMNTAIATSMTGGYMGIGFSIPSTLIERVMNQLVKTGTVTRGFIGVTLQSIDHDLAQAFGLQNHNGALIADVSKGSPAEKAGLKQGDIVQAFNKQNVTSIATLRNAIALMAPGTMIKLSVLRDGNAIEIPIEVGNFPTSSPQAVVQKGNQLGFEVQDLTPDMARTLGVGEDKGVVITRVEAGSPASWAGLKKGTLIVAINQKNVSNVEEFNSILQSSAQNKPVLLLVKQGEQIRFISLKVG